MDAPLPQRRWLRLQFGMRSMLVLMTLAAIGVAMWTRWPYAVEEQVAQRLWDEAGWRHPQISGFGLSNTVIAEREAAYYRRLLGGQRVRHGESLLSLRNGTRMVQRHFREGVLHGEYREWYATGGLRCAGQYNRGRKHGKWLWLGKAKREEAASDYRRTQNWNLGVPHGQWKWEDAYGTLYLDVMYDTGRVTMINGQPVIDYLDEICRTLPSGSIGDRWRLFHRHQANGGYPEWMKDPHERWPSIDIEHDSRLPPLIADHELRKIGAVPFAISLAAELQQDGRAATRRFNALFITLPEWIAAEHDLTGVSSLEPEPGSLVATLFPTNIDLESNEIHFNFRQALHYLQHRVHLPIDDTALNGTLEPRDEDRAWIGLGWNNNEHNVRDLLGLALHRARCRCELIDGVLVIKRQEK
jgi:hypothetical protein